MSALNSVCLCGSTRFLEDFRTANLELTSCGLTVVTMAATDEEGAGWVKTRPGKKTLFDLVHLNKILKTDAVVVVGDGYIGESTSREILWANMQGKLIYEVRFAQTWEELARAIYQGEDWESSFHLIQKAKDILDAAARAL